MLVIEHEDACLKEPRSPVDDHCGVVAFGSVADEVGQVRPELGEPLIKQAKEVDGVHGRADDVDALMGGFGGEVDAVVGCEEGHRAVLLWKLLQARGDAPAGANVNDVGDGSIELPGKGQPRNGVDILV